MTERRQGAPPIGGATNETLWAVMKELAAVSRAQARLTRRLCDLIEMLPRGNGDSASLEDGPTIDGMIDLAMPTDETGPGAVATGEEALGATGPAPVITEFDEVIIEVDHLATGNGGGPAAVKSFGPSPFLEDRPDESEKTGSVGIADGIPALEKPMSTVGAPEGGEGSAEGLDEVEESEGENEMVLTLESGDARVGVLWDQVVQIGSLSTATVPDRIGIDRDEVEVVSLGNLLHGVSREEKYFVILAQGGERAGVACEKMLGLGPLAGVEKKEEGSRIQVLRVPFLLTFSGSARKEEKQDLQLTTQTAEEQDKQGPLRALVAVRYLPARVAICRHLRGRGWQVGEAAGLEAATVSLDLGRWDALFLEARSNGEADEIESTLLRRVLERRVPVIRVGSRISGYPGHDGPALMFPFSEAELDAILVQAGRRAVV